MKAEAKNKSTKERLLEEKEAKGGGVDLGKPTSVDKSSELNKTIKDGDIAPRPIWNNLSTWLHGKI